MNHKTKKTKRMRLLALLLAASLILNLACITDYAKASGRKKAYSGDDYRIELTENSVWNEGCTVNADVENVSQKQIRNWSVILTLKKGKISNAWNVDSKVNGNNVILSSKEYNMVLAENGETSFGFQMQGANLSDIESAYLVTETASATKNLSFDYRETSSWQGHKIVEVTLTNTGTKTIKDWSAAFRMNGEIDNIWNARALSGDEGMFQIKNADYNVVIAAGASVTFGFQVSYSSTVFSGIKDIVLFGSEEKETLETEKPTSVPTATASSTPTKAPEPLPTKTPELVPTSTPKESAVPIVTSVPTATPEVETEEMEEGDAQFVSVENRDWNMDMIHANDPKVEQAKNAQQRKIKVTMLDSGINYSSEGNVVERKNFFDEETSCLYEDESGHGTAIAEILASDPKRATQKFTNDITVDGTSYTYYDNTDTEEPEEEQEETLAEGETTLFDLLDSGYEWTEGVNPNIDLYSGKILDENNETTVDMVVEGIDWAIENQSDILCLSLGMQKGSDKLHAAIKRAKKAGMLIISAVGEDKQADYPAAYPEVMSVGMTDSMGKYVSAPAEVAAPGQNIISRGVFDSMQIFSGNSFAVPHVAGLASILWQNHPDKDADYIRGWIDVTANKTTDMENCEYGLVDCLYALESYEEYNREVKANPQILKKIEKNTSAEKVMAAVDEIDNEAEVPVEEEMQKVHGNWHWSEHQKFVSKKYQKKYIKINKYTDVLKSGLRFVDDHKYNPDCYGMREHPWFHGFMGGVPVEKGSSEKTIASNYMTSVRCLVEMSDYMRMTGEIYKLHTKENNTQIVNTINGINKAFEKDGKIGSQTWKSIDANCAKVDGKVPKDCRSLLIYGMAMHTLTDTFSHSSYVIKKTKDKKTKKKRYEWVRLKHGKNKTASDYADKTDNHQLRFDAAKVAAHKALKRILVDPKEGLTGYTNINKTADLYASTKEFNKLKNMIKIYNGESKPQKSFKLRYTKDAFSLGRFSKYYEADKQVANYNSTRLEKYIDIVDLQHLKKTEDGIKAIQLNTYKSEKYKVYCGTNLEYTVQNESQSPVVLFVDKELDYVIKDEQENVRFTVKDGEMRDALSRKLEVYQDTTENVPDSEEDEENILSEIDDVCPSKECVLEGKIVEFSERSYSIGSFGDMPGLSDTTVSLTSRVSGKTFTAKTDENGNYKIQVPKSIYDVYVQKDSSYTAEKQYLKLMEDKVINKTLMLMSEDWTDEGIVDGYVYTTAGKALANAKVEVYSGVDYTMEEPEMTLYTDAKGYFNTDFMITGGYTFVISKDGYKKQSVYQPVIGYVQSTIKRIKMRRESND